MRLTPEGKSERGNEVNTWKGRVNVGMRLTPEGKSERGNKVNTWKGRVNVEMRLTCGREE